MRAQSEINSRLLEIEEALLRAAEQRQRRVLPDADAESSRRAAGASPWARDVILAQMRRFLANRCTRGTWF